MLTYAFVGILAGTMLENQSTRFRNNGMIKYISELMSEIKEKYPPTITTDLLMTIFLTLRLLF